MMRFVSMGTASRTPKGLEQVQCTRCLRGGQRRGRATLFSRTARIGYNWPGEETARGTRMSHPIDASVKHLVTEYFADWLPLSGRRADGPVEVTDADLSTVT